MIAIQGTINITADGEFSFPDILHFDDVRAIMEWAVETGSATVTPGYVDLVGNFAELKQGDGSSYVYDESGGAIEVSPIPSSRLLALKITASAGLLLKVNVQSAERKNFLR